MAENRPDDYYNAGTCCPYPKGMHADNGRNHEFTPAQPATLEDVIDNIGG